LGGGSADITVTLTDSNLVYADTFSYTFTTNFDQSVAMVARQSITIPVFTSSSAFTIIGVTQGSNGAVSFTGTNLTYVNTNEAAANDYFTFTYSNGPETLIGHIAVAIAPPVAVVTTNADTGPGSLRAALTKAAAAPLATWHISVAAGLSGQSVLLETVGDTGFGASAFAIVGNVTIDSSAAPGFIIARDSGAPA